MPWQALNWTPDRKNETLVLVSEPKLMGVDNLNGSAMRLLVFSAIARSLFGWVARTIAEGGAGSVRTMVMLLGSARSTCPVGLLKLSKNVSGPSVI